MVFPGIPIHFLDGEEAWWTCAAQGSASDHPCPHCLVYKRDLHKVLNNCTVHTVKDMCQAYKQAMAAPTKAAGEEIMKMNGLHKVEVCVLYHLLIGHVLMEHFFKECILVFGKF